MMDYHELINTLNAKDQQIQKIQTELEKSQSENKLLREIINQLKHRMFGVKTEKSPIEDPFGQRFLFAAQPEIEEKQEDKQEEITVSEHKRRKKDLGSNSRELPVKDIIHDIPEEEKVCKCGCVKDCIGEEVSSEIEMVPSMVFEVRHHRLKYACKKGCQGVEEEGEKPTIPIAPVPVKLIPKSMATPSLLSSIFINKFCDSLPFYRQEVIFARRGFELSRATMCTWAMCVSEHLSPLMELLRADLLSGFSVNVDETTIQVLHEPDRSAETKSFMWVFRGGTPTKPSIIYRYSQTRNGKVAQDMLEDYHGYVQTDGYSGYNILDKGQGMTLLGCWAHVRRKFNEVLKASEFAGQKGIAHEALNKIKELYRIESENKGEEELTIARQTRSLPLLDEFKNWLNENVSKIPPKSLLGRAFQYALNQWPRLIVYLNDPRLRMDNNLAENAVRPFVVGRKNWLFSDRPKGAKASATLYSVIETAKASGLDPYKYLFYLFYRIPLIQSEEEWKNLLPQNLTPELLDDAYDAYFLDRTPKKMAK